MRGSAAYSIYRSLSDYIKVKSAAHDISIRRLTAPAVSFPKPAGSGDLGGRNRGKPQRRDLRLPPSRHDDYGCSAQCYQRDQPVNQHVAGIAGLRFVRVIGVVRSIRIARIRWRARIARVQRKFLRHELPVQRTDPLLIIVAHRDRHLQIHVQIHISPGTESPQAYPVREPGSLIRRCYDNIPVYISGTPKICMLFSF